MKIQNVRTNDRIHRIEGITLYLTDNGTVKIAVDAPEWDKQNAGINQYFGDIAKLRKGQKPEVICALTFAELIRNETLLSFLPNLTIEKAVELAKEISQDVEYWQSHENGTMWYCN